MAKIAYCDTHVIVWLYGGLIENFPELSRTHLERSRLRICPIVLLELQYLLEIKRIVEKPLKIIQTLEDSIGLETCTFDFSKVIHESLRNTWTRDPFDRIITAQAMVQKAPLITKDASIRKHYKLTVWD